jgi:RND family efflux transporter MFP subunit
MSTQTEAIVNDQGHEAWAEKPKPLDLFTAITAIERQSLPPRERAAAFLEAVCASLGCLAGSLSVALGGEEAEFRHLSETEGANAWIGTLNAAGLEARSHARSIARLFGKDSGIPEFAVIACPIDFPGRDPFGGVAVLVRCPDIPEAERLQLHLRSACLHASSMLAKPAASRRSTVEMDDIARVYARAGQFHNLHEFAYTIANSARQRFNCDQSSLGRVDRGRIRLLCISGLDQIKRRSPGVHLIEQAMGECADAQQPMIAQPAENWDDADFAERGRLHERWRAATGGACVLSLPIRSGEEVVAVTSFRRAADQPFDADDIDALEKLLAPLAGAIPLVRRATRGLGAHASESARALAGWALGRNSVRKKAVLLLGGAGLVAFTLAPSTFRVSTAAAIVAQREHTVAAPEAALVSELLVRAGQRVERGDLLATLDTSLLRVEQEQLDAEIDAAEIRVSRGVAEGNPAAASLAQAEARALRVRRAGLEARLERASVRAPVDGIVLGTDLGELPGRRVAAGQPLLTIAEGGEISLELRVPEHAVTDLVPGARVRFASHARPEAPAETTLERVAPAAEQRDGRRVFIAEAAMPEGTDWLRPGMEGVATVDAGERPNWWIATHRLIDFARMNFWIE